MQFALLLASSVLYIAGSFGLTMVGNVPLNQRLAKFDVTKASGNEIAKITNKMWIVCLHKRLSIQQTGYF